MMRTAKRLGAKMGLSLGYHNIKSEPHTAKPDVRVLKELHLLEYSVVTFPMNPKASITRLKEVDGIKIEEINNHLVNDLGISHKAASIACDMLQAYAYIEQGDNAHSMESPDNGYSEIGQALNGLINNFKN